MVNQQHCEKFLDHFMTTPKWQSVHKAVFNNWGSVFWNLDEKTKIWFGKADLLKEEWGFEPDGDDFTIYVVFAEKDNCLLINLDLNLEAAE